jgi:hypothetical protein
MCSQRVSLASGKDVLHYLIKGTQPIIVALARGLKPRLEREFEKGIEQDRLLIVTPFTKDLKRVTDHTAQLRNQLMIEPADESDRLNISKLYS